MPINILKNNFPFNSQESDFQIFRFEDFLKSESTDLITTNHIIDFYTLFFISEGVGKHAIDFTDYNYKKGTILSVRKNQIHKFYLNSNTKGFILCFKEEFLNSYLNEVEVANAIQMFNELLVSPKTQTREREFHGVFQLVTGIENEILHVNDKYSLKLIRSLIHILITLIYRIKSEGHNKVQLSKNIKEFIGFQNLLEQDYCKTKKVFDYANKLGFSTKKLNTIVKFITNKSAKEFIDQTVMVKLKSLLLHTNLSVKEIAFKTGFNDSTNLYKYFKKHNTTTPEEFRKQFKG